MRISHFKGQIFINKELKIGYLKQDEFDLHEDNTILQEFNVLFPTLNMTDLRTDLARLGFRKDKVFEIISKLSTGEKVRLEILKLILQRNNLLLLDEPTNHLDIFSRQALEDALKHFPYSILFVSHDRRFIRNLSSKILEFRNKTAEMFLTKFYEF